MLKSHAQGLKRLLLFREKARHPNLTVEVIPGAGKKDFRVNVKAGEFLIKDIMDENASGDYLDNNEQTRVLISSTEMEFR